MHGHTANRQHDLAAAAGVLRVVLQVGGSVDLDLAAVDANGQEVRATTLHHAVLTAATIPADMTADTP